MSISILCLFFLSKSFNFCRFNSCICSSNFFRILSSCSFFSRSLYASLASWYCFFTFAISICLIAVSYSSLSFFALAKATSKSCFILFLIASSISFFSWIALSSRSILACSSAAFLAANSASFYFFRSSYRYLSTSASLNFSASIIPTTLFWTANFMSWTSLSFLSLSYSSFSIYLLSSSAFSFRS